MDVEIRVCRPYFEQIGTKKKLITIGNLIFCKLKSPEEKPTSKALCFLLFCFFNKGYVLAVFHWSLVSATFFDTHLCESGCQTEGNDKIYELRQRMRRAVGSMKWRSVGI